VKVLQRRSLEPHAKDTTDNVTFSLGKSGEIIAFGIDKEFTVLAPLRQFICIATRGRLYRHDDILTIVSDSPRGGPVIGYVVFAAGVG